jgi:hypothetical protein
VNPDRVLSTAGNLGEHYHVCAFFNDTDEQYRVLRSFIKDGLDCGHRAFHLVDSERRDEHLRRLAEADVDVHATIGTGQLLVEMWEQGPLDGRRFDPELWLESFQRALESGPAAGFAHTRFLGHMEWAHRDAADDEAWFDFESRLNEVLAQHEDAVICVYDLATIGAGVVIDALRTHPAVLLDGLLHENPFFVPPDQFVRDPSAACAPRRHARGGPDAGRCRS